MIHEILIALSPLLIGFGSALAFSPKVYRKCGIKSNLQPPGWVFSLVWSILYILIGIACLYEWKKSGKKWTRSLQSLVISFMSMVVWWIIFSNICNPSLAFATLIPIISIVIVSMIFLLVDNNRVSFYLLIPLVLWLCFASLLSFVACCK